MLVGASLTDLMKVQLAVVKLMEVQSLVFDLAAGMTGDTEISENLDGRLADGSAKGESDANEFVEGFERWLS